MPVSDYNRTNDTKHRTGGYWNGRLVDAPNGTYRLTPEQMIPLLQECIDVLTKDPTHPYRMADVYCFLRSATSTMPEVPAWVIMKAYGETDPTSGWHGKVSQWPTAFLVQNQAKRYRDALDVHYNTRAGIYNLRDTYTVEKGSARPLDIVHPSTDVQRLIEMLGRR